MWDLVSYRVLLKGPVVLQEEILEKWNQSVTSLSPITVQLRGLELFSNRTKNLRLIKHNKAAME